jgi:hypothetical protein
VYESMDAPQPINLYNMACDCAMMSALDAQASADDRENLQARAVEYLRKSIERDRAQNLTLVATDLDPLRDRADFRDLMADASFPRDPFVQPSAIALFMATPEQRKIQGDALLAGGRTIEAIRSWRPRGRMTRRTVCFCSRSPPSRLGSIRIPNSPPPAGGHASSPRTPRIPSLRMPRPRVAASVPRR